VQVSGPLRIARSTFVGNETAVQGGHGPVEVVNSTFDGNGLAARVGSGAELRHVTVAASDEGSVGILAADPDDVAAPLPLTMAHTVVDVAGVACVTGDVQGAHNAASDTSCGL